MDPLKQRCLMKRSFESIKRMTLKICCGHCLHPRNGPHLKVTEKRLKDKSMNEVLNEVLFSCIYTLLYCLAKSVLPSQMNFYDLSWLRWSNFPYKTTLTCFNRLSVWKGQSARLLSLPIFLHMVREISTVRTYRIPFTNYSRTQTGWHTCWLNQKCKHIHTVL